MAKKVRVKSGSTTAEVSPELAQSIEKTLDSLAPETKKTIENAIDNIYQEAYKDWPVRFHKSKSGDSKNKLEQGIILDISDGSVSGFIRNTAEYAWAIKVGVNTKIDLPLGARVSNELLWKPVKKLADPIAEALANEITKLIK